MTATQLFALGARRAWHAVMAADAFVRLHFAFFTGVWPLLGAASVGADRSLTRLLGLLAVMACFHVYAYVLNDLVDLPIDRTHPSRQRDPLVRGVVSPSVAAALVVAQPLLAAGLTVLLGGGWLAQATLAGAFVSMGAYNFWGKRFPFPPVMDVVQGLGWGLLAPYAAYALAGEATALTWFVCVYATAFTLFMNGIHGGLRDLANDVERGALTTAIYLGARPSAGSGDPYVPRAVMAFSSFTVVVLVSLNVAMLARNDFGYDGRTLAATAVLVALLNAGTVVLIPKVTQPRGREWDTAFRLQMYLILMSLPAAFAFYASATTLALLAALTAVSLVLLERTGSIAAWAWALVSAPGRRLFGSAAAARHSVR